MLCDSSDLASVCSALNEEQGESLRGGASVAGLVCSEGSFSMRIPPLWPPRASARTLGCWVGRPDAVFCQGWGAPPWGSHSHPPFRPRFSAPHPFHVFLFVFVFLLSGVLEGFFVWLVFLDYFPPPPHFVFSFGSPGFVLDVDAVFLSLIN